MIDNNFPNNNPIYPSSLPANASQDTGIRTAVIASLVNIFLTFLLVNTIGILASGIYLGLTKQIGSKTRKAFYLITFLFFFLHSGFVKNEFVDPVRGVVAAVIITTISSAILAIMPFGIMWIVKKLKK